jgi:CPA1 family monovalent cation:H+ antiporter
MFGSIISCTDPIAVVALLKSLSVNKRLNTIIEGESLINDATGLIFYTIGLKSYLGQSNSIFAIIGSFLR